MLMCVHIALSIDKCYWNQDIRVVFSRTTWDSLPKQGRAWHNQKCAWFNRIGSYLMSILDRMHSEGESSGRPRPRLSGWRCRWRWWVRPKLVDWNQAISIYRHLVRFFWESKSKSSLKLRVWRIESRASEIYSKWCCVTTMKFKMGRLARFIYIGDRAVDSALFMNNVLIGKKALFFQPQWKVPSNNAIPGLTYIRCGCVIVHVSTIYIIFTSLLLIMSTCFVVKVAIHSFRSLNSNVSTRRAIC